MCTYLDDTIRVVYIGREFYHFSGTSMSSVYIEKPAGVFTRTDWGKIEGMLDNGDSVFLVPASDKSLVNFYRQLVDIMGGNHESVS